jgi:hypothetical protein
MYFTKSRFSLNGGYIGYMELLSGHEKLITKSGISLNVGTLNWGFTVYGQASKAAFTRATHWQDMQLPVTARPLGLTESFRRDTKWLGDSHCGIAGGHWRTQSYNSVQMSHSSDQSQYKWCVLCEFIVNSGVARLFLAPGASDHTAVRNRNYEL